MNVFDLFASISLDTQGYEKSLEGAEQKTSSFGQSLGSGLKKSVKVGAAAVGVVTGAAALAGKKIYGAAKSTADYGDSVDKLSQQMGMSTDAYQEWDYVMQISGTEMSSMRTGLKTLTNKFDEAKNGSDSAKEMFEKLGLSMEDLSDLSQEDLFAEVIGALQDMEDGTDRAALANDLFGRSGQELAPLLNTGREATAALKKEARSYGAVMSKDAVKASANFKDRLTRMSKAMSGVKNKISADFMPGLTTIIEGFADLVEGNEDANEALSEGFSQTIEAMSDNLPKILDVGMNIVKSLADGIIDNLPRFASTSVDMLLSLADYIVDSLPELADASVQIVAELADGIGDALPDLMDKAVDVIFAIIEGLVNNADKLIDGAAKVFKSIATGLVNAIPKIISKIPTLVKSIVKAIKDNLGELLPGAVSLVVGKNLVKGIKEGSSGLGDKIKTFLTSKTGLVTVAAGAFVLLGKAISDSISGAYDDAKEAAATLTESQQALVDSINEESEKWENVKKARKDAAKEVDIQVNKYKRLWERLQEICDEQGNVKEGYEEEAKMITGELSEALGEHIELVDNQIQGYEDLKKSIDQTIKKKKAELLLASYEEDYTDALKNRDEAALAVASSEAEILDIENKLKTAKDKLAKAEEKKQKLDAEGMAGTEDYRTAYEALEMEINAAKGEVDGYAEKLSELEQAHSDAESNLSNYTTTISNYDAVMAAVASGSMTDLDNALTMLVNSMETAETGTSESLARQTANLASEFKKQKKIAEETGSEVAQESADQYKELVKLSLAELAKLDPGAAAYMEEILKTLYGYEDDYEDVGEALGDGIASGLKKKNFVIQDAAKRAVQNALNAGKKAMLISSPSRVWRDQVGAMIGKGLAIGIEDSEDMVARATKGLMDVVNDEGAYDTEYEMVGAPSGGYGGNVTINVYGAVGQDVEALADEIAMRFQRMYKREVAKFA